MICLICIEDLCIISALYRWGDWMGFGMGFPGFHDAQRGYPKYLAGWLLWGKSQSKWMKTGATPRNIETPRNEGGLSGKIAYRRVFWSSTIPGIFCTRLMLPFFTHLIAILIWRLMGVPQNRWFFNKMGNPISSWIIGGVIFYFRDFPFCMNQTYFLGYHHFWKPPYYQPLDPPSPSS